MDLLSGYDSDTKSAGLPNDHMARPLQVPSAAAANSTGGSVKAALSHLPPPTAGSRSSSQRVFRVPLAVSSLPDSDDEEEQPAKRVKVTKGSTSLKDLLPAPKNAALGSSTLVAPHDRSAPRISQPTEPLNGTMNYGNEQFRVHTPEAEAVDDVAGRTSANPRDIPNQQQSFPPIIPGTQHNGNAAAYHLPYAQHHAQHWQSPDRGQPGANEGERMLAEAMEAEQAKAAKNAAADPFAGLDIQFKEIKQSSLTHMDATAREAANATRTAFGVDYEARLRSEAGARPEKMARRKHQISSLYHAAKIKELDALETRTQGIKSKAETQAKYGW